jgi:hypothetical protein
MPTGTSNKLETTATYDALRVAAHARQLDIFGILAPDRSDPVPPKTGTIILLGPKEPGFWRHLTAQPEWSNGRADPVDRWSERAVKVLAEQFDGAALFPFGQPHAPFLDWALRSGRVWSSPVTMLVHDTAGLFLSFRGALAIPERLTPPLRRPSPCDNCAAQPCRSACPVGALGPEGRYDLQACHGHLSAQEGRACMDLGCAARRACPISKSYGRLAEQSAYHMRAFHHEPAPDPDAPREI